MLNIAYHPIYQLPLPEGHRFPMEKYDLLPKQLLHEGTCEIDDFFEPKKFPISISNGFILLNISNDC